MNLYKEFVEATGQELRFTSWKRDRKMIKQNEKLEKGEKENENRKKSDKGKTQTK